MVSGTCSAEVVLVAVSCDGAAAILPSVATGRLIWYVVAEVKNGSDCSVARAWPGLGWVADLLRVFVVFSGGLIRLGDVFEAPSDEGS